LPWRYGRTAHDPRAPDPPPARLVLPVRRADALAAFPATPGVSDVSGEDGADPHGGTEPMTSTPPLGAEGALSESSMRDYIEMLGRSGQIERVRSPERAVDHGFWFFAGIICGLLIAYLVGRVG